MSWQAQSAAREWAPPALALTVRHATTIRSVSVVSGVSEETMYAVAAHQNDEIEADLLSQDDEPDRIPAGRDVRLPLRAQFGRCLGEGPGVRLQVRLQDLVQNVVFRETADAIQFGRPLMSRVLQLPVLLASLRTKGTPDCRTSPARSRWRSADNHFRAVREAAASSGALATGLTLSARASDPPTPVRDAGEPASARAQPDMALHAQTAPIRTGTNDTRALIAPSASAMARADAGAAQRAELRLSLRSASPPSLSAAIIPLVLDEFCDAREIVSAAENKVPHWRTLAGPVRTRISRRQSGRSPLHWRHVDNRRDDPDR